MRDEFKYTLVAYRSSKTNDEYYPFFKTALALAKAAGAIQIDYGIFLFTRRNHFDLVRHLRTDPRIQFCSADFDWPFQCFLRHDDTEKIRAIGLTESLQGPS
jgi:hypothetical protein